ncbi:hypothetical protein [Hyphomicrobium sp. DY-1]|jgi:hypothetical protein|uniref:hypothetical protein n=1 Tax=Hyphomicrobium sp. DY-1 TaxID=3075650 RepID=UPI0039C2345C
MATFHIDDETADDGFLYVNVDDLATVRIYRMDGMVAVEICPLNNTDDFLASANINELELSASTPG